MAVLDVATRRAAMADLARDLSLDGPVTLTKDEIVAAVAALDAFLESNAAAINLAIPQPARSAFSLQQKLKLVEHVARYRRKAG